MVEVDTLRREDVVRGHDEQRVVDVASSLPKKVMSDRVCVVETGGRERGKQPDEEVGVDNPSVGWKVRHGLRGAQDVREDCFVPKGGATRRRRT